MNPRALSYLGLALLVYAKAPAMAEDSGAGVLKLPQDIEFKGPLIGPPQLVVLYGDPTKPGAFYVSRVRFSAGWKDRLIGTLMSCVQLSCYRGRSATAPVTNGMRTS